MRGDKNAKFDRETFEFACDRNINIRDVKGTGPDGQITTEDVIRAEKDFISLRPYSVTEDGEEYFKEEWTRRQFKLSEQKS